MGHYRRIDPRIWIDERFARLSDDGKLLALHLLTSPRSNMVGCFVQGQTDMAEYLGWSAKRLAEPFAELLSSGLIQYDPEWRLVLIRNFFRYNPLENENQAKAAATVIDSLPANVEFFQHLKLFAEQLAKPFLKPLISSLENRLANRLANRCIPETRNPNPKPEPETTLSRAAARAAEFGEFWKAYPAHRRKEKADALKAWQQVAGANGFLDRVLAALGQQKKADEWVRDDGRFIPYPAKWLRRQRWEDEVVTPAEESYGVEL